MTPNVDQVRNTTFICVDNDSPIVFGASLTKPYPRNLGECTAQGDTKH